MSSKPGPGRYETLRPDHKPDLKATTVLGMEILEGSAKTGAGGPADEEEDDGLPIGAGVIPIHQVVADPVADPRNLPGVAVPDHVRSFKIG